MISPSTRRLNAVSFVCSYYFGSLPLVSEYDYFRIKGVTYHPLEYIAWWQVWDDPKYNGYELRHITIRRKGNITVGNEYIGHYENLTSIIRVISRAPLVYVH